MKKKLTLILGGVLILFTTLFIYSCAKKFDDEVAGTSIVPDNILQATENWHSQQTQVANTFSNDKKKYVLPPTWKEAKIQLLDNGKAQIIVPGPEAPVDAQFGRALIRKFVFTEQNQKIIDGKIIEMFSSKDSIDNKKENLLENYVKGNVGDFTGVVINYDVNYNRLSSDIYVHGVKQSGLQAFVNSVTAKTFNSSKFAKNTKSNLGAPTTMMIINPDCYYLCYDTYGYNGYGSWGLLDRVPFYEYGCSGGPGNNNEAGGPDRTVGGSFPPANNPCTAKSSAVSVPTWANTLYAAKNNWLTLNYESGYYYTDPNDINSYSFIFGNANSPTIDVDLQYSPSIRGMVHTHPTGVLDGNGNHVPMSLVPTSEDFQSVFIALDANKIVDPATFTSTVITGLGSLYMITITDASVAKSWGATAFQPYSSTNSTPSFTQIVADFRDLLLSRGYSQQAANETALTYYLQNSGLSLIRGDINNTYSSNNYSNVSFSTNSTNATATPCP